MELYQEHYEIKNKFKEAEKNYDRILERKAKAYFNTQPNATDLSKELVQGGMVTNKFGEFIEKLEEIEIELEIAKNERNLQNWFLKKKEEELKNSSNVLDRVYYYRFVEHLKVWQVGIKVGYSKSSTYNFIEEINKNIIKN